MLSSREGWDSIPRFEGSNHCTDSLVLTWIGVKQPMPITFWTRLDAEWALGVLPQFSHKNVRVADNPIFYLRPLYNLYWRHHVLRL